MSLQRVLKEILTQQKAEKAMKSGTSADAVVLEVNSASEIAGLNARIIELLPGVSFSLQPFFEGGEGSLALFIKMELPNVSLVSLSTGPFELSYELVDILGLASADVIFDDGTKMGYSPVMPYDNINGEGGGHEDPPCGNSGPTPKDKEWHLKNMFVPEAWTFSQEQGRPVAGQGIYIGQPDTGVAHHDLAAGAIAWDKGTGLIPPAPTPLDPLDYLIGNPGHGLSVAGAAASRGNNSNHEGRIRGTAPAAMIIPIRAVNLVVIASITADIVALAVAYAINKGVQVISLSLGGPDFLIPNYLREIILEANRKGIIVIAAAGNGTLFHWSVVYPGLDPNTIAVAGSTFKNEAWDGSCRGKEVSITAPAAKIWGPWRGKPEDSETEVGAGCGTSYSTALVAGIAAMWLAHHGRETLINHFGQEGLMSAFNDIMRETATKPSDWPTNDFGPGIVNANALLRKNPTSFTFAQKELRRYVHTYDNLLNSGVDQEILSSLIETDLNRYGNELLWLRSMVEDSILPPKVMSEHLINRMRSNP